MPQTSEANIDYIRFNDQSSPGTTPASGFAQVYISSDYKNKLTVYDSDDIELATRATYDIATSDTTVANNASEATITNFGSLPSNWLTAARTIRLVAMGYFSTTGTPSLTFRMKMGGTEVISSGAITTPSGASNAGWRAEFVLTVRSAGASGTVAASGVIMTDGTVTHCVKTGTTTIDTTTALATIATVQWGTASASNTITQQTRYSDILF